MILITLLLVLTGCGIKEKQDRNEVVFWETYNNEEHDVVVKKIIPLFNKKYPDIKIKVQRVPWSGHQDKLLASMVTRTAPDIARVDIGLMPRLVKSRTVYDLTEFGALGFLDELLPVAKELAVYPLSFYENSTSNELHVFGIPDQVTCVALFYNKKLFRKYGIETPPENWDEFYKTAIKLTRDENDKTPLDKGFRIDKIKHFGFAHSNILWWNYPFFYSFCTEFATPDAREFLFDGENGVKALDFIVKLYKDKAESGGWQAGGLPTEAQFLNEKAAMIFMGPWNIKRFNDAGVDYGVSLIPKGKCGTATNVGGTLLVVLKEAKNPAAAYKFLEFFASKEIQALWSKELGQIPVNVKSIQHITPDEKLKVFIEQVKYARGRPRVIDYDRFEEIMANEIYLALTGAKSSFDALRDAKKSLEKYLLRD